MPKKIEIEEDVCIGCGLCASDCPDCFEIGSNGKSRVIKNECSCDLEEVAQNCPVQAINIKEEE